jgi:hypothetical protein
VMARAVAVLDRMAASLPSACVMELEPASGQSMASRRPVSDRVM